MYPSRLLLLRRTALGYSENGSRIFGERPNIRKRYKPGAYLNSFPNRLAGLDTLRALAIVAVMLFHLGQILPEWLEPVARFGWVGVDLFFVLSGYLIGSQLLKPVSRGQRISLPGFYRRRAYRILPAYLVVLALYELWPRWRETTGLPPLWEFLTFTQNLFVDYAKNANFSHAWSLCVEEHFYLLLPLVVLLLACRPSPRKTVAILGVFFALGLALRSFEVLHLLRRLGPHNDRFGTMYIERVYYPTYTRLDGLLAGVALALVRIFRPVWWTALTARSGNLLAAGSALVGVSVWMFVDRFAPLPTIVGFPILALGFALLVAAAAETRCWPGWLRFPGARLLATLAFSLYLIHKEIAHLDELWLPHVMEQRSWAAALVLMGSLLAASSLLYFGVERPFLMLRDRREGRSTTKVGVEARAEPAL